MAQKMKLATVNAKEFAPKSLENYESVKAAKRRFVEARLGATKWVDHDLYTEICKPWTKEFGEWVAGKGLVKNGKVQKNSVSKATKVTTKTKKACKADDCRVEKLEKRVDAMDKKLDAILAKLG